MGNFSVFSEDPENGPGRKPSLLCVSVCREALPCRTETARLARIPGRKSGVCLTDGVATTTSVPNKMTGPSEVGQEIRSPAASQ